MAASVGLEGRRLWEWFHTLTLDGPELGILRAQGLSGPTGQHKVTRLLRYSRRAGSCLTLPGVTHQQPGGLVESQLVNVHSKTDLPLGRWWR